MHVVESMQTCMRLLVLSLVFLYIIYMIMDTFREQSFGSGVAFLERLFCTQTVHLIKVYAKMEFFDKLKVVILYVILI